MIKLAPDIFNGRKEITIGETNMHEPIGYPVKLSYTVVFICREGKAVINVNFKNYLLKANDILVLAEDSIAIFLRVSENFKMFYCLVNKELASEIAYNLPNRLFSFLNESPLCIPEETEIPLLEMWLEQFRHIIENPTTYQHIMVRNHLQNFFLSIAGKIPPGNPAVQPKYSHKEILCWKFWDMVGRHCKKHRDVAFYAKELCITPFYLSQITKKLFNDSPKDLINRQVILEIKALLSSSDVSIKEIAERLNFDDPSYMCRYFKRQTGVSLSAYRK